MATLLTAKDGVIGNKPLFYIALALQAFVVIFSSIVRLYINGHNTESTGKVFSEFENRIRKIDLYRLALSDTVEEEKAKVRSSMEGAFAPEYEYVPKGENWLLKNGQKAAVALFVIGFMLFVLSLIFSVGINTK